MIITELGPNPEYCEISDVLIVRTEDQLVHFAHADRQVFALLYETKEHKLADDFLRNQGVTNAGLVYSHLIIWLAKKGEI